MTVEASRRAVLAAGPALAAAALLPGGCSGPTPFPGTLGGADMARGHRLRTRAFPRPPRQMTAPAW